MRSSAYIIANPAARGWSDVKMERTLAVLRAKGYETEVLLTTHRGHATDLARESAARTPSMIIAAGGDGTINEVMNGIAGTETPLAIIPLGTTNVLAKELSIPEDISGALERAVTGTPHRISPGRIECSRDSSVVSRYFCLMAGIGFDGKAVFDVNMSLKRISGRAAYVVSGLRNLLYYSPLALSFVADGVEHKGYAAIIGKASRYGGHFRVTPDARVSDPVLYSCIFKGRSRTALLRYVFGIAAGRHLKYPDVAYFRSHEIEIRGDAHVQIDGDYLGITPAKISVAKESLRLIW